MAARLNINKERKAREFAVGCLVYMIQERDPEMPLDFLNCYGDDDSDEGQSHPVVIHQILSDHEDAYTAINSYATQHIDLIEGKYRSFFRDNEGLRGTHTKNFMEMVTQFAYGMYEKPFTYDIIIEFCAHISVYAYISYKAEGLKEVLKYVVTSIAYLLQFYDFNQSKYFELKMFAENFYGEND